ncbi:amidohydrolase family protein [Yinghuangia seranimata]|uniref:amidohydrolase family protein n=1 Tax=Yinghuangia seranimata TaxID=408067 RepID=UPI00248C09E8|nr:amidohydrolase family protein [Yinghuangia seranimata]MDI2124662.1 amidohydrolase family protein [Yinghuangia seranimata]
MPPNPDAPQGARSALRGRIVTMDAAGTVLDDGVVYLDGTTIAAVQPATASPPDGFDEVAVVPTRGTVYPGLIELHNHLPYDVLPLWQVPRAFTNRSQWGGISDYHRLVTGPMTVLGEDPQLMPAVVRYVEAKALVNGTTTSQGIALFSNTGSRRMYRGVVRNVEQTGDPDLPQALSRISDVEATEAAKFLDRLRKPHRLLLHLAEGIDDAARAHFQALEIEPGQWAITDNLVGIHCTALSADDFQVLADHGGSMVWSPLSNLLLYGKTADIAAAKAAGVRIGLGSDWSVSGSKGLLGELKAAQLASQAAGSVFSDRELVAMATCDAAAILRWDQRLGSLQPGHYADLLVVAEADGDPYTRLVDARDTEIALVVIAGTARYGTTRLMKALASEADIEDAGPGVPADRALNLHDEAGDPLVAGLTLAEATDRLTRALQDLPRPSARRARRARRAGTSESNGDWRLALDEIQPTGAELRPRLPLPGTEGEPSGPTPPPRGFAVRTRDLAAVVLDRLTAARDAVFLKRLGAEIDLPEHYRTALVALLSKAHAHPHDPHAARPKGRKS